MKRFLLYVSFILALGNTSVNAQVYTSGNPLGSYTDIIPDSLIHYTVVPFSNNLYSFNVIGNALADLEFTARGSVSSGGSQAFIRVRSLDTNLHFRFGRWDSVYVTGSGTWNVTKIADALDSGEVINSSNAVWDTSMMYLTDHTSSGGGVKNVNDWIGADKYLGFKYENLQTVVYGWMRIECPSADSCYVKDFSVTQDPSGLNRSTKGKIKLYPNPSDDVIYIEAEIIQLVEIRDVTGKFISLERFTGVLTVSDLKPGVYLLKVFKYDGTENLTFIKN